MLTDSGSRRSMDKTVKDKVQKPNRKFKEKKKKPKNILRRT